MKKIIHGILAVLIWAALCSPARAEGSAPEQPPGGMPAQGSADELRLHLPLIAYEPPKPLGDLADEWYLVVDDGHIQYRDVGRIYHPFNKYSGNPVLRADKSWEGKAVQLYGTVLPGFRMWYSSLNHAEQVGQVLYAESSDGLTWRKPDLDGSGRNVLFGGQTANLVSLMHTPGDLEAPYKLAVYQNGVFNGYGSFDGIQTFPLPWNPLIATGSDVAHFYFDPQAARYRLTLKQSKVIFDVQRRVLRFMESDHLSGWEPHPILLEPDIIDETIFSGYYPNFYGMPVFPVGEQYLGLLWFLKARDPAGQIGPLHVQIASSHDGKNWTREEGNRPAMLTTGPPGSWDDGQIYTSSRPVQVGSQFWLYYSGCNQEHGTNLPATVCGIGLAKAPVNRLVSLTGSGTVLTEILEPSGASLHLNADGSKGSIRVELLAAGAAIPGYEAENCLALSEDSLDQTVQWQAGSMLPNIPFQIKFYLEDSSLYAFAQKTP